MSGEWEDMEGLALETTGKWKSRVTLSMRSEIFIMFFSPPYIRKGIDMSQS
jgi:hypothetical protein